MKKTILLLGIWIPAKIFTHLDMNQTKNNGKKFGRKTGSKTSPLSQPLSAEMLYQD